jgi:hypothetical protein
MHCIALAKNVNVPVRGGGGLSRTANPVHVGPHPDRALEKGLDPDPVLTYLYIIFFSYYTIFLIDRYTKICLQNGICIFSQIVSCFFLANLDPETIRIRKSAPQS